MRPRAAARRGAGLLADDVVLARWREELDAELIGAGPLESLLADPQVSDVLVNGPMRCGSTAATDCAESTCTSPARSAVRLLACRLAMRLGRRLDDAVPWVDAGSQTARGCTPYCRATGRVHDYLAARPGASASRTDRAGRVRNRACRGRDDPARGGRRAAHLPRLGKYRMWQRPRCSARSSTWCQLTSASSSSQDAAEIVTRHPHVVRLVARPPNVEGAGAVGLAELVRQSLRMRPDRVVVGEFRGAEIAELLAALNTGHTGGAATVHANTITDIPARLRRCALWPASTRGRRRSRLPRPSTSSVHLERAPGGRRQVASASPGCHDGARA